MGGIIDTKQIESTLRCNYVKIQIIFINLVGASLSLLLLLFGIFRMIFANKKINLLTKIILLIFSSEIINNISKLIQLIKYIFDDQRDDKKFYDPDTPRGIICQIQIVTSIYSDYCSLLGTLLLSLRCYNIIQNKKEFISNKKKGLPLIICIIFISIVLAISFLFLDRRITDKNIGYRYDVRDRCSYWCWLGHIPSLICYGFYWIIIILDIIFAFKTNKILKIAYNKLLDNYEISNNENDGKNTPLNEIPNDNNMKNNLLEKKNEIKINNISKEETKRIEELLLMRIKCTIYPWVTIAIWVLVGTYRIIDDIIFFNLDNSYDENDQANQKNEENKFYEDYPIFQFSVQFFMVIHTIVSAFRGILYGFSFIVFEEKIFKIFFRNCLKKCLKNDILEINEEESKDIIRKTNNSSQDENNERDGSSEENNENNVKNETLEMNTSEYHEN